MHRQFRTVKPDVRTYLKSRDQCRKNFRRRNTETFPHPTEINTVRKRTSQHFLYPHCTVFVSECNWNGLIKVYSFLVHWPENNPASSASCLPSLLYRMIPYDTVLLQYFSTNCCNTFQRITAILFCAVTLELQILP